MRVAIVNDMQLAVECLCRIIISGGHELAWIARNGEEAIASCLSDKPDIVLMDLYMPVMNGVEATRQIMSQAACPILVVTSDIQQHAARTFEAMGAGALDAVNTPQVDMQNNSAGIQELLYKIDVIQTLTTGLRRIRKNTVPLPAKQKWISAVPLIVIGASAGGPAVLAEIISTLPETLNAAVIIVQHVDVRFASELACWLDRQTKLSVCTAAQGDVPTAGQVLIAETNSHLVLDGEGRISYCSEPSGVIYQPSVDVFFDSVCSHWHGHVLALMLTGMGGDGAAGLLKLHKKGVMTLAQNKESCAVYGMPKAAIELGAARFVMTPEEMSRKIVSWAEDVKV